MDVASGTVALQWPDYLVVGIVLSISAGIGIYYRFSGGRQRTAEEYFAADRSVGVTPLAIGMMASLMSGVSVLGSSAENYTYGGQFMLIYVGYGLGIPIVAYFYLPVLYELRVMSVFEYLERRFGSRTRLAASLVNFGQLMLYGGVVLYAPALALESTTGLSSTASILLVGLVCMFYSTVGGIKAVLVTDVFQAILMYASIVGVVAVAAADVEGGLAGVWDLARRSGRADFTEFGLDPTARFSWLSLLSGGCCVFVSIYGVNQVQVQRLLSTRTLKSSQWALFWNWPLILALGLITSYSGLALYAVYRDCDPVTSGAISSADKVMPYFAAERMIRWPCLAGLFVAGIFSASLSTISAMLNSLAAIILEDYAKPCYEWIDRRYPEERAATIGKVLAAAIGFANIGLAFLFGATNYGLTQVTVGITGAMGGPILGIFTLGMFTETANEVGAVIGTAVSLVIGMFMVFGSKPKPSSLPVSTIGCLGNLTSYASANGTVRSFSIADESSYSILYRISYLWYTPLFFLTTFAIGYAASVIYRLMRRSETPELDPRLFVPYLRTKVKRRQDDKRANETQAFIFKTIESPKE